MSTMDKTEVKTEKLQNNKDINTNKTKSKSLNGSSKRYPRAYRITLKTDQRGKEKERRASLEKEDGVDNKPSIVVASTENKDDQVVATPEKAKQIDDARSAIVEKSSKPISIPEVKNETNTSSPENLDDSPSSLRKSRFVKFWSCKDVEALNDAKTVESKKTRSANRRKNRNLRKEAENKEILDNILACIVLMEEKLSKFDDSDIETTDNVDDVDSSSIFENVATEKSDKNTVKSSQGSNNKIKSFDTTPDSKSVKDENANDVQPIEEGQQQKQSRRKRRNRKSQGHLKSSESDTTECQTIETKESSMKSPIKESPKRRPSFRPTHFLAFRLQSPEILKNVGAIHENILNINKDFKAGFVNTNFLYTTLAVMELNDEEEQHKAIKAIEASLSKLNDVYKKSTSKFIEFESLGAYKEQFLYMNMKENDSLVLLQSLVSIIKENMLEQDTSVRKEMFTAHSTVLKLRNRFTLRKKGIKKIPSTMYEKQKDDHFGKEEISELVLCSLSGKKEGEFHKIIATIDLKSNTVRID